MRIQDIEDFLSFEMEVKKKVYEEFGVEWDEEKSREKLRERYNKSVLPHIQSVGKTIGEKDSVFNPLRTITRVAYHNGELCVMYKQYRQKLERFERIRY